MYACTYIFVFLEIYGVSNLIM